MTRLGIKPQFTGYQVDVLNRYTTTQVWGPPIHFAPTTHLLSFGSSERLISSWRTTTHQIGHFRETDHLPGVGPTSFFLVLINTFMQLYANSQLGHIISSYVIHSLTHHSSYVIHSRTHYSSYVIHSPTHHSSYVIHSPTHHSSYVIHSRTHYSSYVIYSPTHHSSYVIHSRTHHSSYVIHSRTHHSRFTLPPTLILQRSAALTIYRHVSHDVCASCYFSLYFFLGGAVTVK